MRNIDKVKALENQNEQLKKMYEKAAAKNNCADKAVEQIKTATDMLIAYIATQYGEKRTEDGKTLWRLAIGAEALRSMREKYEVRAKREGDEYIIGVVEKNEK